MSKKSNKRRRNEGEDEEEEMEGGSRSGGSSSSSSSRNTSSSSSSSSSTYIPSIFTGKHKGGSKGGRRPFGVAVFDINKYYKQLSDDNTASGEPRWSPPPLNIYTTKNRDALAIGSNQRDVLRLVLDQPVL